MSLSNKKTSLFLKEDEFKPSKKQQKNPLMLSQGKNQNCKKRTGT